MPPRFKDEFTMQLKRRMHSRLATDCKFTREDVAALTESTGLSEAQVQQWAYNFRLRYLEPKAREDYLSKEADGPVSIIKNRLFYKNIQMSSFPNLHSWNSPFPRVKILKCSLLNILKLYRLRSLTLAGTTLAASI